MIGRKYGVQGTPAWLLNQQLITEGRVDKRRRRGRDRERRQQRLSSSWAVRTPNWGSDCGATLATASPAAVPSSKVGSDPGPTTATASPASLLSSNEGSNCTTFHRRHRPQWSRRLSAIGG